MKIDLAIKIVTEFQKWRICELDPHYCDIILTRWEKLTGGKAEKITD